MITFDSVGMTYTTMKKQVEALRDVSFEVRDGEFLSILGPSGCGKSTFLFIATGLTQCTSGRVLLDGRPIDGVLKDVGFVFQDHLLLEWRTVLRNLTLQGEMRNLPAEETLERARALLKTVGLEGFEEQYPFELSGGMQQRVSIARAMLHNPAYLMMDEPFGALDALTREQMRVDLEKLWLERKCTILFVTHDINESILLSDRIVVMTPRPGQVKEIIPVDLPRPRNLAITETPEFSAYRTHVIDLFMQMGILHA